MSVLKSFLVLLVFQLLGDALGKATHIAVPGPVLGMVMLAGWYILRRREPEHSMRQTADGLLGWLGLLFVPAGVGIVANIALLRATWFPVLVALLGSTLITLCATAFIMSRLKRGEA